MLLKPFVLMLGPFLWVKARFENFYVYGSSLELGRWLAAHLSASAYRFIPLPWYGIGKNWCILNKNLVILFYEFSEYLYHYQRYNFMFACLVFLVWFSHLKNEKFNMLKNVFVINICLSIIYEIMLLLSAIN